MLFRSLGPKYWGDGPAAAKDAPLIKALGDAAAFLAETGEIKRDDVPASFVPAVNYALLRRAFPS